MKRKRIFIPCNKDSEKAGKVEEVWLYYLPELSRTDHIYVQMSVSMMFLAMRTRLGIEDLEKIIYAEIEKFVLGIFRSKKSEDLRIERMSYPYNLKFVRVYYVT